MNKVCFLMPIYPNHYVFAKNFINSFLANDLDKQADLAFIFSNKKDRDLFNKINGSGYFKEIILDKSYKDSAIVNIKKFYGLYKLQDLYEYIIIIDAETEIIKNVNVYEICKKFYKNKALYGNKTIRDFTKIHNESLAILKDYMDTTKLENLKHYFWFNQPCIYKTNFVKDFFHLTKLNEDLNRLTWESFDYIVFGFYLMLQCDFKIIDCEVIADFGFLENGSFVPETNKYIKIPFMQAHSLLYPFLNKKNLFMIIHLDRWRLTNVESKPQNAIKRVKSDFAYKCGKLALNIESKQDIKELPYRFSKLKYKFEKENLKYKKIIQANPSLKLQPLENYTDFKEALKIKHSPIYKLGEFIVKNGGGGGNYSPLPCFIKSAV